MREKGANSIDKAAHLLFDFANNPHAIFNETNVHCPRCGKVYSSYYCEERLYIVRCGGCGILQLQEARGGVIACQEVAEKMLFSVDRKSEYIDFDDYIENCPDAKFAQGGGID